MFGTLTPVAIFQQQINILRAQMPGLLDGQVESVHAGRIATRRIREILPLTHTLQRREDADDLVTRFKRVGQSLGRVREADVRLELLRYFESRVPSAAVPVVSLRQNHDRERAMLMRKLLKLLERLDLERELTYLAGRSAWRRVRPWTALIGAWRGHVRDLVTERAQSARDAIAHATGVYFPNRAHQARIAIKKCRYAAEIGIQTGVMTDAGILRELRKGQDILGDVHDRQTLLDQMRTSEREGDDAAIGADPTQLVTRVAEAEIDDLYRRFLERRPRLLASLDVAQRASRHADRGTGALAIAGSVIVLGSGLEALRRRRNSRALVAAPGPDSFAAPAGRSVAVRIPVTLGDT
jgi:CHAD domain-containing protein